MRDLGSPPTQKRPFTVSRIGAAPTWPPAPRAVLRPSAPPMFGDTNVAPVPAQAGPPYGQRERLGITERRTANPRKVWRRARDSNPQGACAPVDFKSTALPVEASPPCPGIVARASGRGAARAASLRRPREGDEAGHVPSEHGRDRPTPVRFLAVLEHRDQRPADGQAGAVEGVAVVDLTATGRAVADLGPARLERLAVRA